jgi:type IV secretory pathway VirB2 component (pilin)
MEKIASKQVSRNKKIALGAAIVLLAANANAAATASDSFGTLFDTFKGWLQGNLGKLLALLGFAGTFIVYMMTHKGSVLFIGIVISLIAGGLVGISSSFFSAGTAAFG